MRRFTLLLLALVPGLLLGALPAGASAGKRAKPAPKVTFVSPMRVRAGSSLSIRGRNFSAKRRGNTILFSTPGGRATFVKPRRSSRRRLVLVVPKSLDRFMSRDSAGRRKPLRFTLRVATARFSKHTPRRLSPVVTPFDTSAAPVAGGGPDSGSDSGSGPPAAPVAPPSEPDCDRDGTPNGSDASSDADLLSDSLERSLKTDPCDADTDGDGVEDGYEYQAAVDLNHSPRTPPLPYPDKRPYPNALDPADAGTDYDGDALTLREEHLLWQRFSADGVRRSGHPTTLAGLLYSDGLQKSIDPAPLAPDPTSAPLRNWVLDQDADGRLTDDERDGDDDGLNNWDESHGQMTEGWWPARHDGQTEPKESKYPGINFLDSADLPNRDALAANDIDGDGTLDGADDSDHDGLSNQFEVRRPDDWYQDAIDDGGVNTYPNARNPWAYVNPFNPCKPFNSERCHRYLPFGYYNSDGVPPVGPDTPAGYPGSRPATPDG
ncbi:MAG: hypothetical protein H0V57_00905 [Thermoleophilaceae bacterium]|nr:hypothetical protein [Thermoleophilaceae bacterium]